jgi:hypothetical protein
MEIYAINGVLNIGVEKKCRIKINDKQDYNFYFYGECNEEIACPYVRQ